MIVKLVAIFVLLGVCCALPVEDSKDIEVAPTYGLVPLEPQPVNVEDIPQPPKPGDSDLQTDASSWYRSHWYHHEYPIYYTRRVPHYIYKKFYY